MPLLDQVVEQYPKDVKVVFKHVPLRNHRFALPAAKAATAAQNQGKFWEYHDRLFENYNRLNDQMIRSIAEEVGLDMAKFDQSLNDPTTAGRINQDMAVGRNAGVRGTPTVFVNGRLLKQRSLEGFKAMIDKALAASAK